MREAGSGEAGRAATCALRRGTGEAEGEGEAFLGSGEPERTSATGTTVGRGVGVGFETIATAAGMDGKGVVRKDAGRTDGEGNVGLAAFTTGGIEAATVRVGSTGIGVGSLGSGLRIWASAGVLLGPFRGSVRAATSPGLSTAIG